MTITFTNIPEEWTEKDIKEAVALGLFIKTLKKNPDIFKKIKKNAKKL